MREEPANRKTPAGSYNVSWKAPEALSEAPIQMIIHCRMETVNPPAAAARVENLLVNESRQ